MFGSRQEKNKVLSFDERVDPASTALVVIDVQNDFALPQGICGQVGDDISPVAPMVERLKALIESARKAKILIVYVRTIYDEPVMSPALTEQYARRGYPGGICLTGTPGAAFYGGIGPQGAPNELLITKYRYSAFWSSPIDLVLRTNAIRTVVLTGIATEVCVELTARDAFFKDYQVVVPEDCTGCYSEDRQKASLVVVARSFGMVTSSEEIKSVWQRQANGPRNWQPESRAQRALSTLPSRLDPRHTALVLMGIQRDLFAADGGLVRHGQSNRALIDILLRLRQLLAEARKAGCLVIHAKAASEQGFDLPGGPVLSKLCAAGGSGAQLMQGFEPAAQEQLVTCHRFSGFADTQLDVLLRSNCIRTVVIAGATTNCAIDTTVRDAFDRDYHVVVARDGVATLDSEMNIHAASLANMARYFGEVIPSSEITSHWSAQEAGRVTTPALTQ